MCHQNPIYKPLTKSINGRTYHRKYTSGILFIESKKIVTNMIKIH